MAGVGVVEGVDVLGTNHVPWLLWRWVVQSVRTLLWRWRNEGWGRG